MRRWSWLALVAVIFLAVRPLLSTAQFFYSDDGLLHLLRVFALDRTLRHGVIYPRTLVDLAWGMGYPIFDFYPPLAAYLAEALHIFGLDFALAIKAIFFIAILIAALGAYRFCIEIFSKHLLSEFAAVLTAISYILFPYFLTDIYVRGALAETFAAALLPWLFWSWHRALTRSELVMWLTAALTLTLTLVAHSLTVFIVSPVLAIFILLHILALPRVYQFRTIMQSIGAVVSSLGLGAFYWIPFIFELADVRMGRGMTIIRELLPGHLLEPMQVVQGTWAYHYTPAPFTLSLVAMLLGAVGLISAFFARRFEARRYIIYFGLVTVVLAGLMTTIARNLWLSIPFAMMVQYPWRLAAMIGLALSIIIGSIPITIHSFPQNRSRLIGFVVFVVALVAMVLSAMVDFAPQPLKFSANDPSLAQLARFERYTTFIGTTTWGEYLPATFQPIDLAAFRSPAIQVSRADVNLGRYDALHREFEIRSSDPVSLSLRELYFPDWSVTVDNLPSQAYPNTPLGLLAVDLPAGSHSVAFLRGDTLTRRIGLTVSLIALAGFLGMLYQSLRNRAPHAIELSSVVVVLFSIVALPATTAFFAQPPVVQSLGTQVSPSLEIIGLGIEDARLENGIWRVADTKNILHLRAFWHVRQNLSDRPFTWQLVNAQGTIVARSSSPARYGTGFPNSWIPNEVVEDWYDLPIDGLPAGRVDLQVAYDAGAFTKASTIEFVRDIPATKKIDIPNHVNVLIGDHIRLLGYNAPSIANAGESLPVTLYWQAAQKIADDYTVFLQLQNARGETVAHLDTVPGGGLDSTFLWQPGRTVEDQRDLNLPRNLGAGLYHLVVGMYHYPDLNRLPVLIDGNLASEDAVRVGEIKIKSNNFATPSRAFDVSLGPSIGLRGYDFSISRNQIALTVYWQAHAKLNEDYRVFIHLVDSDGKIVAQEDRAPADGGFPTRSWDSGETIVDGYTFSNLPRGLYKILVGMYSPATGVRLPATDAKGREFDNRQIPIMQFEWTGGP